VLSEYRLGKAVRERAGITQRHRRTLSLPVGVDAGRLAHKEAIANKRMRRGKRLTA